MNKITRLAAALVLSGLLLAAPAAQAAPSLLGQSSNFELEVSEMELEITADDPRPKAYLYTGGQSDYYFIVWMSSNPTVATVDGDGRVTGRSAGEATISAITDRGEYAACRVTVRKESGDAASKKPALDHVTLNLIIQYDNAHPSQKLQLINTSGSFIYAYQWMSSDPEVATVDTEGLVTAQKPGTTTITGAARLRLKESDRLETTARTLNALGGQVEETEDGLVIHGKAQLTGGTVDAAGDHRIAMAAAVASGACAGPVTVTGAQARQIFSLRSATFDVSCSGDTFTFAVTGFGHGVGMSQYGADTMAKAGKTYQEILLHYYTDVTVAECPADVFKN